ncbi:hypothetical protein PHMEG_00014462 [Phytophthora megakarya]|uniref:MULE transposase domain-containing protein n=1 Tax=Phytophthora megakarya TaxID=4795 RepID=A0A225W5B5_9STRA|nr:hypothetical protein PHMEG_00014462 [Phytophthora megakarya]
MAAATLACVNKVVFHAYNKKAVEDLNQGRHAQFSAEFHVFSENVYVRSSSIVDTLVMMKETCQCVGVARHRSQDFDIMRTIFFLFDPMQLQSNLSTLKNADYTVVEEILQLADQLQYDVVTGCMQKVYSSCGLRCLVVLELLLFGRVYRRTGCKPRLAIRTNVHGYELVNMHTCMKDFVPFDGIVDCMTAMEQRQVCTEYQPDDDLIRKGLSEEQVTRRVYHVRQKHYGAHLFGLIEIPPLSMVEGKHLSFFQFHLSRSKLDPTSNPDRLIGWAHPELRRVLMYNGVSLFFDGTFRCEPIGFKQCMVLMVHDQASELFVPVYFVLCSSKGKDMYCDVLEQIYRYTSRNFSRATSSATLNFR